MISLKSMLGTGLLKKEKKVRRIQNTSKVMRKKVSVEVFLRKILGTHLIEKKF